MNTHNDALPASVPWQSMYLVLSITMISIALVSSRRRARTAISRSALARIVAAACTSAATLAAAVASSLPSAAPLSVAALIVGGAGFGLLYLAWGDFYSKLEVKQAVAYLFGGGIIAALVKIALAFLPHPVAALAAACIPFASIAMSSSASAAVAASPVGRAFFTAQNIPALWKVATVFVVFSIANASTLSLLPPNESVGGSIPVFVAERGLELALCAGVLVYVFKLQKAFDFVQLWRVVLLILATDFLMNILHPGSAFQPFFAGVSLNFIVLFVWLVLADVSHHADLPPALVFGFGWSCYALPFYAGSLIVMVGEFTVDSTGYFATLMYVVALTAAFCLEARDQNTKHIFLDLDEEAHTSPEDFTSIDLRCEEIGRRRGLTAREVEVMQMLCKGRSKAYIAETLFITENTVKGHAKRLYAKLDVHSKKDLQQLIDAY